jgi:hypothetical protein
MSGKNTLFKPNWGMGRFLIKQYGGRVKILKGQAHRLANIILKGNYVKSQSCCRK